MSRRAERKRLEQRRHRIAENRRKKPDEERPKAKMPADNPQTTHMPWVDFEDTSLLTTKGEPNA